MTAEIPLRLYLRPSVEGRHSIERVFRTVLENLPSDIDAEVVELSRRARGLLGRIGALGKVLTRAPGVHHVTGDVHFIVLALPWRRTVLTVHDLVHLDKLDGARRVLYRLLWFTLPLRLAAAVTVISAHTGKELLKEFPNVATKLRVIPNPLPSDLGPAECPRHAAAAPVILHVGTMENKNLPLSIAVAQRIGAELSILGRLDDNQWSTLERSGIAFHAQFDVADERLADIYRSADVLLFASLAEGFGMPIIEAQACGVPVVTSDREPMISVAGGAALLVDPSDVAAAEAAVSSILSNPTLRDRLVRTGYSNSDLYSSRSIAAAYSDLYRELALVPR
jgi:glycosyltransferase involved in cell wall biosynthesis